MTRLRVKNWAEFQHYRSRRPPWIKLHRGLLDDYAWHRLPEASLYRVVDKMLDDVRTRLAAHEYPRIVEFVSELPLTATGKIIRRALRSKKK